MDPAIIVLDVDGTILNSCSELTHRTALSIRRISGKGKTIILATGRSYAATRHLIARLGLRDPVIVENGSRIVDPVCGAVINEKPIDVSDLKRLIDIGAAHGVQALLYREQEVYSSIEGRYRDVFNSTMPNPIIWVDRLHSMADQPSGKLLYLADPWQLDQIEIEIQDALVDVFAARSYPFALEIAGRSKGEALAWLIEHRTQAKSGPCMAVGDGESDLSLFEYADISVAMGNAMPNVYRLADRITATNDEDGVAILLDSMFGG